MKKHSRHMGAQSRLFGEGAARERGGASRLTKRNHEETRGNCVTLWDLEERKPKFRRRHPQTSEDPVEGDFRGGVSGVSGDYKTKTKGRDCEGRQKSDERNLPSRKF